jgi:hypothetical protein
MPYDQLLAERVRRALEGRTDMVEKAMFGGLAFMVSGNMCCGVNRDDLIIRLDTRTTAEQLDSPHVRPWISCHRDRCPGCSPSADKAALTRAQSTNGSSSP